jgi:hypothetical protein
MLKPLGVRPENSDVTVGDGELRVRFGRWRVATPLSNIAGFEITEDYRWFKAIGIRGSLADHGLTFGTNADRGLCVRFVEPIPSLTIGKMIKHPGMTLTVADVDGLAGALRRHGVEG